MRSFSEFHNMRVASVRLFGLGIFSLSPCPYRLWGPPNLLYNG